MSDENTKTVAELLQEIEDLKKQIQQYENKDELGRQSFNQMVSLGLRVFLGPSLDTRLKEWLRAVKSKGPFPIEETGNVLAAIIRRRTGFLSIALLGVLVGGTTTGLLLWQNFLIRTQIIQQSNQNSLTRKTQLLEILYKNDCFESSISQTVSQEVCKAVSNPRSRVEAAVNLVSLERQDKIQRPNLSGSILQNTEIGDIDFTDVDFSNADFTDVDFTNTNLTRALFHKTKFDGAIFTNTKVIDADFRGADLSRALLTFSDFTGSIYDASTIFPSSFNQQTKMKCVAKTKEEEDISCKPI